MADEFDPDAYLGLGGGATATAPAPEFDPDQYLGIQPPESLQSILQRHLGEGAAAGVYPAVPGVAPPMLATPEGQFPRATPVIPPALGASPVPYQEFDPTAYLRQTPTAPSGIDAATAYGQQQGLPDDLDQTIADYLKTPGGIQDDRAARAILKTVGGLIPQNLSQVADLINPFGAESIQNRKILDEIAKGRPAQEVYTENFPELASARQALSQPVGSQQWWDAVVPLGAEATMMFLLGKGAAKTVPGTEIVPRPAGPTAAAGAEGVAAGAEGEMSVAEELRNLARTNPAEFRRRFAEEVAKRGGGSAAETPAAEAQPAAVATPAAEAPPTEPAPPPTAEAPPTTEAPSPEPPTATAPQGLVSTLQGADIVQAGAEGAPPTVAAGVSPAPAPAAPAAPEPGPATTTLQPDYPITEVPLSQITLSKDVPQFKAGANEKGVVEPLAGKYERVGTPPVQLWQRNNGALELISGRHRMDLAQRTGETSIPAQIHREADGFDARQAARLDAEINIRDNQGSVADYANYFRDSGITQAAAEERGLLARGTGKAGFSIARGAGESLFALHQSARLTDAQAQTIAEAAPGNEGLQRVGIKAALGGASAQSVGNLMRGVKATLGAEPEPDQLDLLSTSDAAMQKMANAGERAGKVQREIGKRIIAVEGAARHPGKAKALGVDVGDPASVVAKAKELKALQERAKHWDMDDQLRGMILKGDMSPEEIIKALSKPPPPPPPDEAWFLPQAARPELRPGERGTGELFQGEDQPFNLMGETGIDFEARRKAAEAEAKAKADAAAAAEQAQGLLFTRRGAEQTPLFPGYDKSPHIEEPAALDKAIGNNADKGSDVVAPVPGGGKKLKLDVNMQQLMALVGPQMYTKPIAEVAVKELLQNALDASRSAGATDANPKTIHITTDPSARTIEVRDSGTGMTPEIIQKAFFTIGGTFKTGDPANTSGGLGLAKMAFILGSERIRLETVKGGVKSVVDASSDEIRHSTFDIKTERTNEPNGTSVTVKIPKTFLDSNGEPKSIYFDHEPSFLSKPLMGPVEVALNGRPLALGVHQTKWQKDNVFNFSWGKIHVYVDPAKVAYPNFQVLSAGLHQFDVDAYTVFGWGNEAQLPYNFVLDVRPNVRTDNAAYPFNNQREGFRGTIQADVEAMWKYFQRQGVEQQLLEARDVFSDLKQLPEVDPTKSLTQEQLDKINAAYAAQKRVTPYTPKKVVAVDFTPEQVVTRFEGGKRTVEKRQEYVSKSFKPERDVDIEKTALDVSGLDPAKPYLHNNTTADFSDIKGAPELNTQVGNALIKFMREFGKVGGNYEELQKTDPSGWFGGISFDKTYRGLNMVKPFKSLWFNPAALSSAALRSPEAAASETLHIFIHELTHVVARSEGASFTSELANNYARLRAFGVPVEKFEQALSNIYAQHWDALNELNQRLQSYNTKNSAASFKSSSALGPERPEETKRPGKGAPGINVPGDVGVRGQRPTGVGRVAETNPNAGPIGEILQGKISEPPRDPQRAPLEDLTERVTGAMKDQPKTPVSERVSQATRAAKQVTPKGASALQRMGNAVKANVRALRSALINPPAQSDFKTALKDWLFAHQKISHQVRQWTGELRKAVPDPLTREAITNYIQADGNLAVLEARANASKPKYQAGYLRAMNLTDAEKTVARNVSQYFDVMLKEGQKAGILKGGLENYITQIWKKENPFTKQFVADLQTGKLQKSFSYARRRMFDSFFEGEQAGRAPATKDFTALVGAYDQAFNRTLAARGFINALREAKAADGEPVVKFSGMTQRVPSGDVPPEAYLIRSGALPKDAVTADGRAYRPIDHPALRGWKFVTQEGAELPAYHQTDMLVHPDHYRHMSNVLKTSPIRQNPVGRFFLKGGALLKQTRLSLSPFHLTQEAIHAMFHRVNPANLTQIDFNNPEQARLIHGGLQVADYDAMELFSEGLSGGGLVSKIPGLGKLQVRFNDWLFKDYIPRLKMSMALEAYDRNVKRYPNLAPNVLAEITANQSNAAFGELNYKMMGRSPIIQDALRLALLAPDFLEARSRFVGQALKPYGQEQRIALLLGMAAMYVTARALNKLLDDDPHWASPFSVFHGGREYRLRTVFGDAYEAFTDPRRFVQNRLSPVTRSLEVLRTGRDYRGVKLSAWGQVKDFLSWFLPISVDQREVTSPREWAQTTPQRLLASAGVANKPADSPEYLMAQSARRFKDSVPDPKVRAEMERRAQETYVTPDYARLNTALANNDKEKAVGAAVALMKDKGKTVSNLAKYYGELPFKPFTGSVALDRRWLNGMNPGERAIYQKAIQQRMAMRQTFFGLYPTIIQQARPVR